MGRRRGNTAAIQSCNIQAGGAVGTIGERVTLAIGARAIGEGVALAVDARAVGEGVALAVVQGVAVAVSGNAAIVQALRHGGGGGVDCCEAEGRGKKGFESVFVHVCCFSDWRTIGPYGAAQAWRVCRLRRPDSPLGRCRAWGFARHGTKCSHPDLFR
ncbi:protein of unknown function (plasmid) [Cupriavidus taiwanensis]|uniref:Uncharacterized protein n=1 Tax=Cupriavidus taiwanensis TaxID=164546 RepID=A0A375IN08_9BURK|nr:protein of unknown function [Cupriavidus taiwanensis]